MRNRRFFSRMVAVIALLAAPTVGCTRTRESNPTSGSDNTLTEIIRRGELRAGYFIEPPAVMKDPNTGELRGTFVDAINAIGKALGVKVAFVEVDLARFAAGLQSNLFDVSIGPTFKTIQRATAVSFTNTVFYLGYDGIVRKGKTGEFRTEADIDRKGVKVAVKEGSAIQQYVRDNFKNAEVIVLPGTDLTLPLQAVSSTQADVGLMNEHTVDFYVRQHPEVETVLTEHPLQVAGMAWAVRATDLRWLQFLNTSLEFLISTGTMEQWERQHYFGRTLRRQLP
jgi:ABC-type amino acid transport substrate-binding protein